jgi:hypothetical protein
VSMKPVCRCEAGFVACLLLQASGLRRHSGGSCNAWKQVVQQLLWHHHSLLACE